MQKKNREEKMQEIQNRLVEGTQAIFDSDKYKEYLKVMSRFPSYSINNCILIAMQCPTATYVCGYKKWQEFERTVDKGQKGIMILAPYKFKEEVEENIYDSNHHLVIGKDGKPVTEKVTKEFQTFRPVYVFDYQQTSGKELPGIVTILSGEVPDFEILKEALIEISPVPVAFEPIEGGANGYFSISEQRIVVKESMSELQTIKTLIHEIAHAKLGHGGKEDKYDRQCKEVQAESVAYWVSQMFSLDTSEYSFGYISGWSKDKEVSELKEHLNLIKTTANEITQEVEGILKLKLNVQEKKVESEENTNLEKKVKSASRH